MVCTAHRLQCITPHFPKHKFPMYANTTNHICSSDAPEINCIGHPLNKEHLPSSRCSLHCPVLLIHYKKLLPKCPYCFLQLWKSCSISGESPVCLLASTVARGLSGYGDITPHANSCSDRRGAAAHGLGQQVKGLPRTCIVVMYSHADIWWM